MAGDWLRFKRYLIKVTVIVTSAVAVAQGKVSAPPPKNFIFEWNIDKS